MSIRMKGCCTRTWKKQRTLGEGCGYLVTLVTDGFINGAHRRHDLLANEVTAQQLAWGLEGLIRDIGIPVRR